MLPWKMVRNEDLRPTHKKLTAANGTNIVVMGSTEVVITVGSLKLRTWAVVSDNVQEPMLGIDWLTEHQCVWDFSRGKITIRGCVFSLHSRKNDSACRRVVAADYHEIPP